MSATAKGSRLCTTRPTQAKPNLRDCEGDTPLHVAVKGAEKTGCVQIVRLLLEHGASTSVRNDADQVPLDVIPAGLNRRRRSTLEQLLREACEAPGGADEAVPQPASHRRLKPRRLALQRGRGSRGSSSSSSATSQQQRRSTCRDRRACLRR